MRAKCCRGSVPIGFVWRESHSQQRSECKRNNWSCVAAEGVFLFHGVLLQEILSSSGITDGRIGFVHTHGSESVFSDFDNWPL